ncbi:MAG: hypothetical protein KDC49_02435 [Saprospiraceae bacterium]|nr:hypothetical protein [Saprospiraceae bacterium]
MVEIKFEILLINPPAGVLFGLQKGSGNAVESLQKQMSGTGDLSFTFEAIVKGDSAADALPKLSGAFVQGPAGGKFVYIGIGTYAGQWDSIWSRRLKVPLTGITWEDIDATSKGAFLRTKVPGTGKDGGPNCATVKPFEGWKLVIK